MIRHAKPGDVGEASTESTSSRSFRAPSRSVSPVATRPTRRVPVTTYLEARRELSHERGLARQLLRGLLAVGSAWILFMHYLDLYWLVLPNLHPDGVSVHWLDIATLAGAVVLMLGSYRLLSKRTREIQILDPRLAESLHFDNA